VRKPAVLPRASFMAFRTKTKQALNIGNSDRNCCIHGLDVPENTGFSDYVTPFREVKQRTRSFGPVRTASKPSALFHSRPQPGFAVPGDVFPCAEMPKSQIIKNALGTRTRAACITPWSGLSPNRIKTLPVCQRGTSFSS